jgi:hypothetical protein
MKTAQLNYWIDLLIGLAFTLSAMSGLLFLLPFSTSAGYTLGLSHSFWNDLHIWSSVALVVGVLIHALLHWKWVLCMTKKSFLPDQNSSPVAAGRRRFLYGGLLLLLGAALGTGKMVVSAMSSGAEIEQSPAPKPDTGHSPEEKVAEPEPKTEQPSVSDQVTPSPQAVAVCVACPKGLVNDPYPGRCRRYVDRDDDGICDKSIPGSGNHCVEVD